MTLTTGEAIAMIAVMAVVTFAMRLTPFALFDRKDPPKTVLYMGRALPPAIMAVLIIFCLRNIDFFSFGSRGIPELFAALLVVLLHLWKRNNLLSIFGGTIIYMIILQNFPPM